MDIWGFLSEQRQRNRVYLPDFTFVNSSRPASWDAGDRGTGARPSAFWPTPGLRWPSVLPPSESPTARRRETFWQGRRSACRYPCRQDRGSRPDRPAIARRWPAPRPDQVSLAAREWPLNAIKMPAREQTRHAQRGEFVGLVREHAHRDASGRKPSNSSGMPEKAGSCQTIAGSTRCAPARGSGPVLPDRDVPAAVAAADKILNSVADKRSCRIPADARRNPTRGGRRWPNRPDPRACRAAFRPDRRLRHAKHRKCIMNPFRRGGKPAANRPKRASHARRESSVPGVTV